MHICADLRTDLSEKIHYGSAAYPAYIKSSQLSLYPNYAAPSHWHDDLEFIAVSSGEMNYSINGHAVTLSAGDGIFVNSRQLHYGFSPNHKECRFVCVLLHPMLLCISPYMEKTFVAPIINRTDLPFYQLHADCAWEQELLDYVRLLYEEKDSTHAALKIQIIFHQMWLLLFEHLPQSQEAAAESSTQLSALKEMIHYIHAHYPEKISLGSIAAAGGVSPSKCCGLFRQYLRQTPVTYLTDYRLNQGAKLLRTTDYSVTEISYAVGFHGASYFSETFHKWLGCTPREYRRANTSAT